MSRKFSNGRVDPRRMICAHCLHENCAECVNGPLERVGLDPLCECKKEVHK